MQLPLNVSPVSASFVGLQRLGIPRVLFLACVAHMRSAVFSVACLGKIEVIILHSVVNVLNFWCPGNMPHFSGLVNSFLNQFKSMRSN